MKPNCVNLTDSQGVNIVYNKEVEFFHVINVTSNQRVPGQEFRCY